MKAKAVFVIMLALILINMMALSFHTASLADSCSQSQAESEMVVRLGFVFYPPIITEGSEFDSVEMPELPKYGAPGEPILPFKSIKALIPMGRNVQGIDVTAGNRISLKGIFNLEYGKTPIPISSNISVDDSPNQKIYGSEKPFPTALFSRVLQQHLRGYEILRLNLHPIQYIPRTGELSYFENMTVTINLAGTSEECTLLRNLPQDRALVSDVVDNPGEVGTYIAAHSGVESTTLADPLNSFDYVVITSNALRASFLPLINWKIQKGLNATVVLVEDIMEDPDYHCDGLFGDGLGSPKFNDTQAHIRNFIKDAYRNWGTEYVLLGGDDEIIPARGVYCYESSYVDYNIPCDLYYGALDGSWDNDNDMVFGEDVYQSGTAEEEADFLAEVYVGRATVSSPTQAANFVAKTIAYEQSYDPDYFKSMVMIGEKLDYCTEGGNGMDTVTELIPQYTTTRLYSRDGTFSPSTVIDELNGGPHLVNHNGHASWGSVMGLSNSDVDGLINDRYFMAYSLGCYSAAFDSAASGDTDAIGEHFVFGPHGAFAYIGNSRYGWYLPGFTCGPGECFVQSFFSVLNNGITNLGRALQISKQESSWSHRWTYFTLNLLGDPEIEIVTTIRAPTAHFQISASARWGLLLTPPRVDAVMNLQGTARRGLHSLSTFSSFTIEYGSGTAPVSWMTSGITLSDDGLSEIVAGTLASWNTSLVTAGIYTLRLRVFDAGDLTGEDRRIVLASSGWTSRLVFSDWDRFSYEYTSIAADGSGNLVSAGGYFNSTSGHYEIRVSKSSDAGNRWATIKRIADSIHSVRYPSIAVDPSNDNIFVVAEREIAYNNHDIIIWRCIGGVWTYSPIDVDSEDDRFPSITCEYQFGSNWQYVSYEYVYNYDDRDLMFAVSTDQGGTWSLRKLHGDFPDYNVHAQPSITNAEGSVYIAYKWGADYDALCEIRVDRSADFGSTWNQLTDIDGLPNSCSFPSIAATHGGSTVMVAFQYQWSSNDIDVMYSYSANGGTSWTKGQALFVSGVENETFPIVTVDGCGSTQDNVMGYFHAFCRSNHYIEYRRARYDTFGWSQVQIANEVWMQSGLAATTQFRNGSDRFFPCLTWVGDRAAYYGGSFPTYYSTPGASIYLDSDPIRMTIEIDGLPLTAPLVLDWIAGYGHDISTPSPQYTSQDTRWLFEEWSDGGAQSHTVAIGELNMNVTVSFTVEYALLMDTDPIEISPQPVVMPEGLWYSDGEVVTCTAENVGGINRSNDQYIATFDYWSIDGEPLFANPIIVSMTGPHIATAHYQYQPMTLCVPVDFPTIQQAIDYAIRGDIVLLKNGTYHENPVIDKSIALIGENVDSTIIDGEGFASPVVTLGDVHDYYYETSGITVADLTIRNGSAGVYLIFSSHNNIMGNKIIQNEVGILLECDSLGNTISRNCIENNGNGISLSGNPCDGYPKGNSIVGNQVTNNGYGVYLFYSKGNIISENRIEANSLDGIVLDSGDLQEDGYYPSENNTISGNVIDHNRYGLRMEATWDNDVTRNKITDNIYGIMLDWWPSQDVIGPVVWSCENNTIAENIIEANSQCGIQAISSTHNFIFHNNFLGNGNHVVGNGTDIWDDGYPSGGNYWSDYVGVDVDNDEIGDTPYVINAGNQDSYPLINPYVAGDINYDGAVTVLDLYALGKSFGASPGDSHWNARADTNNDDVVDNVDLSALCPNYGKQA